MLSLNFSTRSAGTLERADNASGWHCPLLFPEGLAPSVIFPGTGKSGNTHEGYECVCPVCEAMHGEARERAGCCEGPELAVGCAASSDTPSWAPASDGGPCPRDWSLEPSSSKPFAYTAPDECRTILFSYIARCWVTPFEKMKRLGEDSMFLSAQGREAAGWHRAGSCLQLWNS